MSCLPWCSAFRTSFAKTIPITSSRSSVNTGILENPCSSTRACTSRSVLSDSIATMSGLGTMTSRTIVSPNSKIEWISWVSSRSIEPSSWPIWAIDRRSASETNGPCLRPRPGSRTFARPISARVGSSSTRPRNHTSGATARAARSECSTPKVLLIASTITK